MIGLLQQPKDDGYPFDYLLARLQNRRHRVGQVLISSGSGPDRRRRLQQSYRWVYVRLSPRLRRRFAPCFLLPEIRTLQRLVRAADLGERQALEQSCRGSLLNRKLLQELMVCRSIEDVVSVSTRWLDGAAPPGRDWVTIYHRAGSRGLEEGLADGLMQALARQRLQADVASYLADQIDRRNLLTVARYLRWELDNPPLLEGGGTLSRKLKMEKKHGRAALQDVVERFAGEAIKDLALLERQMLVLIGRRLERAARDVPGAPLLIDYLWRLEMEFRARGVRKWIGEEAGEWEYLA